MLFGKGGHREPPWTRTAGIWPHYDEYAKKTDPDIPVAVIATPQP